MARTTRTSQRAAEEAAQAAPPPSASQFNSPESLSAQMRLRKAANPRSPSPQDENQNGNAPSSAPSTSAQITDSANAIGPKTPPRSAFRTSPTGSNAEPRKAMGDLKTPPPKQPTPLSDVDENVAPGGRNERCPDFVRLRRRHKESPELTDINAIFWESNIPVVHAAEQPPPQGWEGHTIYYQGSQWDTDYDEYPADAKGPQGPPLKQQMQGLTMKDLPKPQEGKKLKLRVDMTKGQIWMGVRSPMKTRFADSDNTSDEDEDENVKGRKQNQRVDENGVIVTDPYIHPITHLPTSEWLEDQMEKIVDQCSMAQREWNVVDRDMSSLYGDILRENDSIEQENVEEGWMWEVCDLVVDPKFLEQVKRSALASHDTKQLWRLTEPFLEGEPEEEAVRPDEGVEDGPGGGEGPGGGGGGHQGGPRGPGGGGYSGPGEDDGDNDDGPDGGLGRPEGNHGPEVGDNEGDNGVHPASEGNGDNNDEDENGVHSASDDLYEVDTGPHLASDNTGDIYAELEDEFAAAREGLCRFDADARERAASEGAADFYAEDEDENGVHAASGDLREIDDEDENGVQAPSDGPGNIDAEENDNETGEGDDDPRALRHGRRLEGVDELSEEFNNREDPYTDIRFPIALHGLPTNAEPWMMYRGAGHQVLVQRALYRVGPPYGVEAFEENPALCEDEEDREYGEEREDDEDQVNPAVGGRTFQVYRDHESEDAGEHIEPDSGPQNVPGTLPNGDPEGFEDFWSDTEGVYIPDPNRVYTYSEDEEEQSGDESNEEPREEAREEVRRAPLVSYESDDDSEDEAHHADAGKSDSDDDEKKTPERRPLMPRSILKRPRDSDDDDSSENDSDDENEAPRRPIKRRRISGRYGASNENAPVDSASQAENDTYSINETDESSSENRRLSTIIERPSSEDRAEEADVLEMLAASNSRTPSTSPGPSLEPDASFDFYDFNPSRTPSPSPNKIFDNSDFEDAEMTDDTDDPASDDTQPNSDRSDDSSDDDSSDEDDAAALVPAYAAITTAPASMVPALLPSPVIYSTANPAPGPAGPSNPGSLVATAAQNPRPLRRHETTIVDDVVYWPENRD